MKAIVYEKYGPPDVLQLKEVEKPAPKDNQVLIKVHAASLNALDWHQVSADIFLVRMMGGGMNKPKDPRLGADVAGRVESVGRSVTQFKPGEEVFGGCNGAFAEFVCTSERALALKPSTISFEDAASVPVAALTALQGLRDTGLIQPGQKVLIYGAGGGVGTFAVQIAKSFGAEVTAVCGPGNVDMVRSIGAEQVIDYTKADFARMGRRYDLILAVNGYHPILAYRRALNPTGIFVMVGASSGHLLQAMFESILIGKMFSRTGGRKMGFMGMAKINQKDLIFMRELLEAGEVVPVIDKRFSLSETVEALRYLGKGHTRGKVVITVE